MCTFCSKKTRHLNNDTNLNPRSSFFSSSDGSLLKWPLLLNVPVIEVFHLM